MMTLDRLPHDERLDALGTSTNWMVIKPPVREFDWVPHAVALHAYALGAFDTRPSEWESVLAWRYVPERGDYLVCISRWHIDMMRYDFEMFVAELMIETSEVFLHHLRREPWWFERQVSRFAASMWWHRERKLGYDEGWLPTEYRASTIDDGSVIVSGYATNGDAEISTSCDSTTSRLIGLFDRNGDEPNPERFIDMLHVAVCVIDDRIDVFKRQVLKDRCA